MTHRFFDKEQRELDEDEDAMDDCFFVFFSSTQLFCSVFELVIIHFDR